MSKEKGEGMKDKQFIVIGYSLIDNDTYRKTMTSSKGIEMTYQWLRRHIIRAPLNNVYAMEVFKRYYMKGILAVSINERELARKLFISVNTLRKNLTILEENGFLKSDDLKTKTRGGHQLPQKVYKLGRWVSETDLEGTVKQAEFLYMFDMLEDTIFSKKS